MNVSDADLKIMLENDLSPRSHGYPPRRAPEDAMGPNARRREVRP